MKVFTDADMKCLKKAIPRIKGMKVFKIPALIKRLELAEYILSEKNIHRPKYCGCCGCTTEIERWKKAAGR